MEAEARSPRTQQLAVAALLAGAVADAVDIGRWRRPASRCVRCRCSISSLSWWRCIPMEKAGWGRGRRRRRRRQSKRTSRIGETAKRERHHDCESLGSPTTVSQTRAAAGSFWQRRQLRHLSTIVVLLEELIALLGDGGAAVSTPFASHDAFGPSLQRWGVICLSQLVFAAAKALVDDPTRAGRGVGGKASAAIQRVTQRLRVLIGRAGAMLVHPRLPYRQLLQRYNASLEPRSGGGGPGPDSSHETCCCSQGSERGCAGLRRGGDT